MFRPLVFVAFSFFLFIQGAIGQDLIVTVSGDSIKCQINSVDGSFIHYTVLDSGKVFSTMIPTSDVAIQKQYVFAPDPRKNVKAKKTTYFPRFRLGFGAGYSYSLFKSSNITDPTLAKHEKRLRNGLNIPLEFSYAPWRYLGVGVRYSFHYAGATSKNIETDIGLGNPIAIEEGSDRVFTNQISFDVHGRFSNNSESFFFIIGWMPGYLYTRNNYKQVISRAIGVELSNSIQTHSFGSGFKMGFDIRMLPRWYLGFSGEVLLSFSNKVKIGSNTYHLINREISLSRTDASIGIRHYW